MSDKAKIQFRYLSQEDLLQAGCLDFNLAIDAAEKALLAFRAGEVMFPEKIVQIFNEDTQERINCLPATLKTEKICGMKWVSVFPPNVERFGLQNLTCRVRPLGNREGLPRRRHGRHPGVEHPGGSDGCAGRQTSGAARRQGDRLHREWRAGQDASAGHEDRPPLSGGMPRLGEDGGGGSNLHRANVAGRARTCVSWRPRPTVHGPCRKPTSW